ncbi:hypothetical protein Cyrtocomes_00516 [Candidatus Cyrtobacter comes]|uniref:F-BAR domain-containing protein n=1 Tax=Candidatus Cyrtobacter comes TaxID=675776 RepID=A0ABU5L8D0_9RICK|nr:hypothetical protein [Candidatus Cyrtobacter comes]MDZ5762145.1 hypothetical protein [Candidatus Cyrtobacter comes]
MPLLTDYTDKQITYVILAARAYALYGNGDQISRELAQQLASIYGELLFKFGMDFERTTLIHRKAQHLANIQKFNTNAAQCTASAAQCTASAAQYLTTAKLHKANAELDKANKALDNAGKKYEESQGEIAKSKENSAQASKEQKQYMEQEYKLLQLQTFWKESIKRGEQFEKNLKEFQAKHPELFSLLCEKLLPYVKALRMFREQSSESNENGEGQNSNGQNYTKTEITKKFLEELKNAINQGLLSPDINDILFELDINDDAERQKMHDALKKFIITESGPALLEDSTHSTESGPALLEDSTHSTESGPALLEGNPALLGTVPCDEIIDSSLACEVGPLEVGAEATNAE